MRPNVPIHAVFLRIGDVILEDDREPFPVREVEHIDGAVAVYGPELCVRVYWQDQEVVVQR